MSDLAAWPDTFSVCFKKRLTDAEVAAFQDVITERIPTPATGEIKSAVIALSRTWADKLPDGDNPNAYIAPPSPQDLLRQMIRARHELASKQSNKCEQCHNGWMSFRFYIHEAGDITLDGKKGTVLHPADETGGMPVSCPCVCSLGEVIAAQLSSQGFDSRRIQQLRSAVLAARSDWYAQRTEVAPESKTTLDTAAKQVQNARKLDMKGSDWP